MRITVHVSSYYDWTPLPDDVVPTEADIKKRLVKPDASRNLPDGRHGWTARVSRQGGTHTTVMLPEQELAMQMIQSVIKEQKVLNRSEAVETYLARHVMPHHAHRSWVLDYEVHDERVHAEDLKLFEAMVDEHVACGNLTHEDKTEMMAAYQLPLTAEHHVQYLKAQLKKPVKGV